MKRLLLVLAGAALLPAVAFAASLPQPAAVSNGASYVASLQQPGGGFAGSSVGQDMDAIIAIRSAGYDPAKVTASDGSTPVDFVEVKAASATKPADAAKVALGATALGLDPSNVAGTNVEAAISSGFDDSTGRYAADDFSQAIAMLGVACTGGNVPQSAVTALESARIQADGGWGFQGASDPDTTAIAVQALIASGVPASDPAVAGAIQYFKTNQLDDGGWGFPPASNVDSTAYVIQALIAAGEDPATYTKNGVDPVSYLVGQQQPDGSFPGFSAALAAEQAIPALAGRTFCNAASTNITHQGAPPAPSVTPTPTASATQSPSGTPTAVATTPAPSSPSPSGHSRTPGAPSTGSGVSHGGPNEAFIAAALAFFALATGGSLILLKKRE